MERKVMILSAGVGSGHNSAAAALQRNLANRPDVSTVTTLDILTTTPEFYRTVYDDGYFEMVAKAPWLVGWGYDHDDDDTAGALAHAQTAQELRALLLSRPVPTEV